MKPLLTYEDVGRLCHMSKWWVMKQRRAGKITPIRFGPMVRFTEDEVERFIKEWWRDNGNADSAPEVESTSFNFQRVRD